MWCLERRYVRSYIYGDGTIRAHHRGASTLIITYITKQELQSGLTKMFRNMQFLNTLTEKRV